MKKITTKVTEGKNGGIHSLRQYQGAITMLREHTYRRARLYHLCFGGADDEGPYKKIINALAKHLRQMGMPCQWRAALEEDEDKKLHMHAFFLIESDNRNPNGIINHREDGWLFKLAAKKKLKFDRYHPRNHIHRTADGEIQYYASVPLYRDGSGKLSDCEEWISYLYKNRSKPDRRQIYFSSKPTREDLQAEQSTVEGAEQIDMD